MTFIKVTFANFGKIWKRKHRNNVTQCGRGRRHKVAAHSVRACNCIERLLPKSTNYTNAQSVSELLQKCTFLICCKENFQLIFLWFYEFFFKFFFKMFQFWLPRFFLLYMCSMLWQRMPVTFNYWYMKKNTRYKQAVTVNRSSLIVLEWCVLTKGRKKLFSGKLSNARAYECWNVHWA